jgi:hypothetical protein
MKLEITTQESMILLLGLNELNRSIETPIALDLKPKIKALEDYIIKCNKDDRTIIYPSIPSKYEAVEFFKKTRAEAYNFLHDRKHYRLMHYNQDDSWEIRSDDGHLHMTDPNYHTLMHTFSQHHIE